MCASILLHWRFGAVRRPAVDLSDRPANFDDAVMRNPQVARRRPEPKALPPEPSAVCEEDTYDDEQDHHRCADCKGSGWYVGFTERRYCPTCDGSGFL